MELSNVPISRYTMVKASWLVILSCHITRTSNVCLMDLPLFAVQSTSRREILKRYIKGMMITECISAQHIVYKYSHVQLHRGSCVTDLEISAVSQHLISHRRAVLCMFFITSALCSEWGSENDLVSTIGVCMCIYIMCVCVYIYINIYTHTRIYVCIHAHK